jgi:chromosome segregation ATPase
MLDIITIALFVLAFISLVVGAIAIAWLSIVSKHLSALGKRVLESEDIGRIIEAANKTESFESRITGCQSKADESQNQLAELQTKLSEIAAKQVAAGQMMERHTTDIAKISEKMASFELRFDEFENNAGEKLNQLLQLETKANELAAKLESIEHMANKNDADISEAGRNIKTLTDEIGSLKEFRTTTEKTHSLIQAAFTDTQAGMPPDESREIPPETDKFEKIWQEPLQESKDEEESWQESKDEQESSQESKDEQEDTEDHETPGSSYKFEL